MSLVKDFLQQKDNDYSKYIPPVYNLSEEDKAKVMFINNLRAKHQLETAAKCMKPCFKNFTTTMISESESECMTNCVAKGLETLSHLHLQYSHKLKQ